MINIELLKIYLLKKGVSWTIATLAKIPGAIKDYFETTKNAEKELTAYLEALQNRQLTEEQRDETNINFLD